MTEEQITELYNGVLGIMAQAYDQISNDCDYPDEVMMEAIGEIEALFTAAIEGIEAGG